jgi:hypothetical protein
MASWDIGCPKMQCTRKLAVWMDINEWTMFSNKPTWIWEETILLWRSQLVRCNKSPLRKNNKPGPRMHKACLRLFNWGDTIYVPYCDYLEGTPLVNKPWSINPGLTLLRILWVPFPMLRIKAWIFDRAGRKKCTFHRIRDSRWFYGGYRFVMGALW